METSAFSKYALHSTDIEDEKILKSRRLLDCSLFTFTVGKDGTDTKEITVHSGPIATHSEPLSVLMNGRMHEAQAQKARIQVDVDTFQRFCEYVYFRAYTDPAPEPWPELETLSNEAIEDHDITVEDHDVPVVEHDFGPPPETIVGQALRKKKKHAFRGYATAESEMMPVGSKQLVEEEFMNKQYYTSDAAFDSYPKMGCDTDIDTSLANYAPVLMGHARLYAFADQYGIQGLKNVVLEKLYKLLTRFNLNASTLETILDLAEYLFDNTPSVPNEPARDLIVHYVVAHIDEFMSNKLFDQVVLRGGDFVNMILAKMHQAMT